jgi:lactate permease
MWNQVYNPFNNAVLSTIAAALPVVTLLVLIASNKVKAHIAAVIALIVANLVAIFLFTMPTGMSLRATVLGAVTGFFPIGWIVLNVIFLYRLTVEKGAFETLQTTIGGITNDRRLQLLLIAFSFGAFFEGASGFGTPVAVTGAILIGLGFSPLAASGLSLIANTAPVAYGALGTPIAGLASVTGIDPYLLGAMVGRQLPFFSLIVPFWLIWAFAGFRGMPCAAMTPRRRPWRRSPRRAASSQAPGRSGPRSCPGSSSASSCCSGVRTGSRSRSIPGRSGPTRCRTSTT